MISLNDDDMSISITTIFIKLTGLWTAANRSEQRIRNATLAYTLIALLFALWIQTMDIYHSWGDLATSLYATLNLLSLIMSLLKILLLLPHKKDFFHLVLHIQRKFLHADYDDYERTILHNCKRQCVFFVCSFVFLSKACIASYMIRPIIEPIVSLNMLLLSLMVILLPHINHNYYHQANIGKNKTERILPFNLWVNLPLSLSPYYEIAYSIECLSMYHICLCYFCFDNFLCIMSLHAATQFRILQYRMENMADKIEEIGNGKVNVNSPAVATKFYMTLKDNIRHHQDLIAYCNKMEEVFSKLVLLQLLVFSLLICLDGIQILMTSSSLTKKLIFICHLFSCSYQLLMFTYSCDCIIRESVKTATSVYSGPWTLLPMTTSGRLFRNDLMLMILRAHTPCCITANGFSVVSLEMTTGVLSTAASYFTLLKQTSESSQAID